MSERTFSDRPRQERPRDPHEPTVPRETPRESGGPEPEGLRSTQRESPHADERAPENPGTAQGGDRLLPQDEADNLRRRWESVQASFVDQPRDAVAEADELVGQVIRRIEERFESERGQLEAAWASGEDVSTEELRITLRRYAAFFDRLLDL